MMNEHNQDSSSPDPPPPYSPTASNHPPPPVAEGATPTVTAQQTRQPEYRQARNSNRQRECSHRHTIQYEGRQNRIGSSEGANDVMNHTIGTVNASNSFSGFIDIMYDKKKLPWGCVKNMIYKLGLFLYFLVSFAYSIVATVIQGDHFAYHIAYMLITSVGLAFELGVLIVTVKKCLTRSSDDGDRTTQHLLPQRADEQVQNYYRKLQRVLEDYLTYSLGEFLIYPTLICVMYGFINERSWQFDNGISVCNFILLVYSVIMDALYMKFYVIFLVRRVLRASYAKYDELARPTEMEWKRYFTPVYLSIPLAITTALTHWFMTAIIGMRIYIDVFNTVKHNTNSSVPDTGVYRVAPFTGYMIACTIYLPIVSWITYIIINKLWFYKVYSAIHQLGTGKADHMPEGDDWDKKLFAFIKDPLAYIAIVLLMVPFIAFIVGTYLPDYDSPEYEVPSSARDVIQTLGPLFIGSLLLSNFQAAITFIVVLLLLTVTLILCGLPVCGVVCYKRRK